MDNIVTISNVKENVLEFNADIEGLNTDDMAVKFVINANGMDIGFNATHLNGTKWEVKIPPLPILERTAYSFKMDVISEGYFFEPLEGTVNVVGSHDIYVSTPKSIAPSNTSESKKPSTDKILTEQEVVKKSTKKIADKIVAEATATNDISDVVLQRKNKGEGTKDASVKSILTQIPKTEKVSKPLKESKNSITKVSASKKVKVTEHKSNTKSKTSLDDIVKNLINEQQEVSGDKQTTVNTLKRLN